MVYKQRLSIISGLILSQAFLHYPFRWIAYPIVKLILFATFRAFSKESIHYQWVTLGYTIRATQVVSVIGTIMTCANQ